MHMTASDSTWVHVGAFIRCEVGERMSAREKESNENELIFEEAYKILSDRVRSVHVTRIEEMPTIELYLDQVLSIINEQLAFMYAPNEKIITGAMVNNYVKQGVVPAPLRKRYSRRHIASLIFVCAFKRVLTISQIEQLFKMGAEFNVDYSRCFDAVLDLFEDKVDCLFPVDPFALPERRGKRLEVFDTKGERVTGLFERILENATIMLAYKVHADLMLGLDAHSVSESRVQQ